jgi:hypothetical protein
MTRTWLRCVLLAASTVVLATTSGGRLGAQAATAAPAAPAFSEADARRWLTYLSSDLLQGRRVFTEGFGLAASYIAGELRAMGVEPLGDEGTYFQGIVRRGYRVAHNSTVTVTARGETRTFKHGEHVSFPAAVGGKQTLKFTGAEFVGYGLGAVAGSREVAAKGGAPGKLVLFIAGTPQALTSGGNRVPRTLANVAGRAAALVGANGAAAAIGFSATPILPPADAPAPAVPPPPAPGGRGAGRGAAPGAPNLTTTNDVTKVAPPALTADETFFDFVLGTSGGGLKAIRDLADKGEPLPALSLADVQISIDIDTRYDVLSTERTQNVVAIVRGSDPVLQSQYVMFGAHLDHVGFATGTQPRGRVNTPLDQDGIWNGADDDGSGTTALLLTVKALQNGPRPKRSVVFVWHAGEEEDLIGSLYMANHPVVPLDDIQAQFNIDMIGRNRDNDTGQADNVFVIGADRISTDLHNAIVEANAKAPKPMHLDYEYNDVNDTNSFYTRSDHYSYASRGVPVAFFFTGTHPDYHANTDTVDKILFPKLLRITELVYRSAWSVADRPDRLVRDNLGPRSGRGFSGTLSR